MPEEMMHLMVYAVGLLFSVVAMRAALGVYRKSSIKLMSIHRISEDDYQMLLVRHGYPLTVRGNKRTWIIEGSGVPTSNFLSGTLFAVWLKNRKLATPVG
jgi:hypothetical protein